MFVPTAEFIRVIVVHVCGQKGEEQNQVWTTAVTRGSNVCMGFNAHSHKDRLLHTGHLGP